MILLNSTFEDDVKYLLKFLASHYPDVLKHSLLHASFPKEGAVRCITRTCNGDKLVAHRLVQFGTGQLKDLLLHEKFKDYKDQILTTRQRGDTVLHALAHLRAEDLIAVLNSIDADKTKARYISEKDRYGGIILHRLAKKAPGFYLPCLDLIESDEAALGLLQEKNNKGQSSLHILAMANRTVLNTLLKSERFSKHSDLLLSLTDNEGNTVLNILNTSEDKASSKTTGARGGAGGCSDN